MAAVHILTNVVERVNGPVIGSFVKSIGQATSVPRMGEAFYYAEKHVARIQDVEWLNLGHVGIRISDLSQELAEEDLVKLLLDSGFETHQQWSESFSG